MNRITTRPACINEAEVCIGSQDKLQYSNLGEVLCHAARLQAYSSSESSSTVKHTCNLSDLTEPDKVRVWGRGLKRGVRRNFI